MSLDGVVKLETNEHISTSVRGNCRYFLKPNVLDYTQQLFADRITGQFVSSSQIQIAEV